MNTGRESRLVKMQYIPQLMTRYADHGIMPVILHFPSVEDIELVGRERDWRKQYATFEADLGYAYEHFTSFGNPEIAWQSKSSPNYTRLILAMRKNGRFPEVKKQRVHNLRKESIPKTGPLVGLSIEAMLPTTPTDVVLNWVIEDITPKYDFSR